MYKSVTYRIAGLGVAWFIQPSLPSWLLWQTLQFLKCSIWIQVAAHADINLPKAKMNLCYTQRTHCPFIRMTTFWMLYRETAPIDCIHHMQHIRAAFLAFNLSLHGVTTMVTENIPYDPLINRCLGMHIKTGNTECHVGMHAWSYDMPVIKYVRNSQQHKCTSVFFHVRNTWKFFAVSSLHTATSHMPLDFNLL